jgi:hypothetical protein
MNHQDKDDPKSTPRLRSVAVLRSRLGLQQGEMADLLGCSESMIQSLEIRLNRISDWMAQRAEVMVGISAGWLIRDNPSEIPIGSDGMEYGLWQFDRSLYNLGDFSSDEYIRLGADVDAGRLLDQFKPLLLELFKTASARGQLTFASAVLTKQIEEIQQRLSHPSTGSHGETFNGAAINLLPSSDSAPVLADRERLGQILEFARAHLGKS